MANYDANYNPNADPAFDNAAFTGEDNAAFTGEDNAEYHVSNVDGADTSLETAAREDRDAAQTDSHERPSKCTWDSSKFR
jgi:hypothetical protein